jgi:uncharacterized protein (TIRG00374 family)
MNSVRFKSLRIVFSFILLAATVVGASWVILHYIGGRERFFGMIRAIAPWQWAVLIVLTVFFYFLDYVRWYTLLYLVGIRLRLCDGIRLTFVSYFVSTLTPTMELHLPVMVFLLMKAGVPGPKATAVTMTKSLYMVLWICIFSFVSLQTGSGVHLPELISKNIFYYTLPLVIFILFFFSVVFFPQKIQAWCHRRLSRVGIAGWKKKVITGFDHWAEAVSSLGKSTHPIHLVSHGVSILFLGVYVVMGYFLSHVVFGMVLSWGKAVTVFSNSLMVAYLAPVPGSMGITELVTNYLLDPSLTPQGMMAATLLRFSLVLSW